MIVRLIAAALPWLMLRALRRGLSGVWGAGTDEVVPRGAVVVANHHSWWDGYLLWWFVRRAGRPLAILIDDVTIERFPFFRHQGGVAAREVRAATRLVRSGAWLVVFPEGAVRPPGRPQPFSRGAHAISRWADAPIVPLGVRVVVRGLQYPEAYVRVGAVLPPGSDAERQRDAVTALVARIDTDIARAGDAEAPVPGYAPWIEGRAGTDRRAARFRRWWTR
jgi:1-acyl-sn-glycerol-3-phosphate acyltransferase